MIEPAASAFTVATEEVIANLIRASRSRLVVIAPAVSQTVADAVCEQMAHLSAEHVALVFDSDPEVYRLGYGELESLEQIQRQAATRGVDVRHQPGIRIGVVIADHETLVFTPTPRLVEAGPNTNGGANAIRLGVPPHGVEADLAAKEDGTVVLGRRTLSTEDLERTKADLEKNPPQKFDLARTVRIFNAYIEFVELEVRGTELSRRTVALPPHLLAVADKKTREQIETRFRLVPPEDKLSGEAIDKDRKLLTRRFLHTIPNFGTVVLHRDKEAFLKSVEELTAAVHRFSEEVEAQIQARIDKSIAELVKALIPALSKRPPKEWIPSSGAKPDKNTVKLFLEENLRDAFGTAASLTKAMEVRCVVKGVTYDMLTDPRFLGAATKVIPELQQFHNESQAVEGEPVQPSFLSS